jgi:membrane associated rhomboid family serine protease
LVSLAWLLAQQGRNATTRAVLRALWILPLAWCAFSAATLAVMGSWQAAWVGGVALLLVGLALRRQST